MNRYRPAQKSSGSAFPIIAFLLVASFGILFAGCGGETVIRGPEEEGIEDVTFTADDVARVQEETAALTAGSGADAGSGESGLPLIDLASSGSTTSATLDLSMVQVYTGVRTTVRGAGDVFRVMTEGLKLRTGPSMGGAIAATLSEGSTLSLLDFVNAAWAHVELPGGQKGYVSTRSIAKVTSEDALAEEKKAYAGQYYVHFKFVNVRSSPDQKSQKLGEIPQDTFVKPISIDGAWARISFQGKEGYVSTDYLPPFLPQFLVRQDVYHVPVLQYDASQPGVTEQLAQHVEHLRQSGYTFLTVKDFGELVLAQEERDVRPNPKSVIVAVTNLTKENYRTLSTALSARNVRATLFLETSLLGLSGITEKNVLTLLANGFDLQSAGHTGDDLRALTNAQVKLELEQSRQLLEEYTKRRVLAVAYPQGGVNDRVMQMAAAAGYLFGLGNAPQSSFSRDQFLRLPSFSVTSSMTAEDVLAAVK